MPVRRLKAPFKKFLQEQVKKKQTELSEREWRLEIMSYYGFTSEPPAYSRFKLLIHTKILVPAGSYNQNYALSKAAVNYLKSWNGKNGI